MSTGSRPKPGYIAEYIIGAGYLLAACLAVALCSLFTYFTFLQPRPVAVNTFATSLPPTTATPSIRPGEQDPSKAIILDHFDDNKYRWKPSGNTDKAKVENGKLVMQSMQRDTIAIADCDLCGLAAEPYFLQADLSTDVETDEGLGIIFNRFNRGDNFFFFEIHPRSKTYRLYHHMGISWSLRIGGRSDLIRPFPAANTLGIYAKQDRVELYINGRMVDWYTESKRSFSREQFAFCSSNSGFKVFVDNLIISK